MTWLVRDIYRQRSRTVWAALGTAIFGVLVIIAVILLPVLALIGSSASFAPIIAIPFTRITLVIIGGYALTAGLLILTGLSKYGVLSWVSAIAAIITSLITSIYPLFAIAFTAVDRAGDAIPWILDLISHMRNTI